MRSIPGIQSNLPFENIGYLPLLVKGKSVSLRFYMGSSGSVTITIGGITKQMFGNTGTLVFTPSEISNLNLSTNLDVSGYIVSSPDLDNITINVEDTSKISNLVYTPTDFSFTILYNKITNNDTLDFMVSLNT